ncbi:Hypothetical predicted protein, partial [Paramuricea clavata]
NLVSNNHLPAGKPECDINTESYTTFLPSAEEQLKLVNELVILVGHKWAEHVPELSWYKDFLPDHIQHNKMEEMKRKTENVIYD